MWCVAVCCRVPYLALTSYDQVSQRVAVRCNKRSVLQRATHAVCCSAMLCDVACFELVCCGVLRFVALCFIWLSPLTTRYLNVLRCVATLGCNRCSALRAMLCDVACCDVVCCSVSQCVAMCLIWLSHLATRYLCVMRALQQCVATVHCNTCSAWQRVALCGSAWQCVAVRGSVLQCGAVCCSVLQCALCGSQLLGRGISMCCSVVRVCVAMCCNVLQCVAVHYSVLQCVAVCCSVLQCVAVHYSVLHCLVLCCSVL